MASAHGPTPVSWAERKRAQAHNPNPEPTPMPRPLAYYDSAAGLIPCTADAKAPHGAMTITISASRSGYRRGERLTVPAARVFPRSAVQRSFKVAPFAWITTPEGDLQAQSAQAPRPTPTNGDHSNAD